MADRPRLLFVLSNDFGELANALYFLAGQPLGAQLLMPERLLSLQEGTLPCAASAYDSADEIISAIRAQRPDAVMLFSGYLYGVNSLFDTPALHQILAEASAVGARVATTDPFLGLLSRPGSPFNAAHPLAKVLTPHFAQVARELRDVFHLYLCDAGGLFSGPCSGFFNPALMTPRGEIAAILQRYGFRSNVPRWLLALSAEDYAAQCNRIGSAEFHKTMNRFVHEIAKQGRDPVLLAPSALVDALQSLTGDCPGVHLVRYWPQDLFHALSLDAEFAFYWNIFSNSILARVANHGSVFFFHEGHLPNAIPSIRALGLQRYYHNAALPFLNEQEPLVAAKLQSLAASQTALFAPALERFAQLPSPAAVIAQLLRGGVS